MTNHAVYIKFFNKTSESLLLDPSGTTKKHSHWKDVPDTIPPQSSAAFRIVSRPGKGSEGTIAFNVKTDVDDTSRAHVRAYASCPYLGGSNEFYIYPLAPEAVYVASFRSWAGSSGWQDNSVASEGSPVAVEFTIKYATSRYRFTLVEIAAKSDYPLCNSRDELITGTHCLWRSDSDAEWADGNYGSYAPNVFAYESDAPVAEAGHLDVTVRPLDSELVGAEAVVYGSIDGIRTLQTDYFYIETMDNVTVPAHVVDPDRSPGPFKKNADVVWSMELRQSLRGVLAVGPHETRLELYWLKATTHPAFSDGLPVEWLRAAFRKSQMKNSGSNAAIADVWRFSPLDP
ncbi:hypothetical protein F4818DRAFT_290956 [Hypoxylon cercidicola]|nr:hypothetical protein F4818DRAFT_290956 [Hypoxylon cercidicola]